LHASDNSFSGTLPEATGQLTNLEELILNGNDLTGQLPNGLGSLTLMENLSLTNNAFGGTLPELERLTNLRKLSIQRIPIDGSPIKGPGISGPVPALKNHLKLTKLQLENQYLDGSLDPDFLLNSPFGESVEVDLRNNKITGNVPDTLLSKPLLSLYLAGNFITGVSNQIVAMGSCPNIIDWMGGDIRSAGCEAFLCPPGKWALQGRSTSGSPCQTCDDDSTFWGRTTCQSSTSVPDKERQILVNFYSALGGGNWKNDLNWLDQSQSVCGWQGISCDSATGRVASVALPNNGLIGMVPEDIFDLPGLKILNLQSNQIAINFSTVSNAQFLEALDLAATGIRFLYSLQNLASLPNFRYLSLASNSLSGPIPEAVFSITSLEYLDLSYNGFTGTLSSSVGGLKNLQILALDGAALTGQLPQNIGSLTHLEEFSAANNKFTGTLPTGLSALTNLEKLALQQAPGTGAGITGPLLSFTNLEKLDTLYLDGNSLIGELPSNFLINSRNLQSGIYIGLSDNRLEGTIPDGWSRFDTLFLDLAENQISGIAASLCNKANWMDGAVQKYQCDAILCPVGTYNTIGFKTDNVSSCLSCPSSTSLGATSCNGQGTTDDSSELNILLDIFRATGGNEWDSKGGWDTSTDYCVSFYGVECDAGRITSIDLRYNNLKGTVPQSIFRLTSLRDLILSGNPVKLTFEGITTAERLINLHVENTNIDSLDWIGSARNLQVLNAADNNIEGTVPDDIYKITTLKTLNLGHNAFSGPLGDLIGGLKSLEFLLLYHNNFAGNIPAAIGDMTNLQVLNLAENNFDGTIPVEINELTNLRFLSIQREGGIFGFADIGIDQGSSSVQGIGLTGPLPAFDKLTSVTELYLGVNGLTGTIPYNFLGGVKNKESEIKVDLTSNALTGTLPASLTQFDNMSLYASGNRFTGIANGICGKFEWMDGDVGSFQCDGVLCPVGTYNSIGRKSSATPSCQSCSTGTNGYLGSFECLSSSEVQEESERSVLMNLYNAMDGPNWIDSNNWLDPDVSVCDWKGIQCDSLSAKSVTSIDLSYNGLSNQIFVGVFKLPNLKELNLQGNSIQFYFNGINDAVNLASLDLEDTGLNSLFGIGQARNLKLLRVGNNDFTSFPTEVFDLPNLEVLSLSNNLFSQQAMPSNLQSLNSMTYFGCSGCGFRGPIPTWLGSMQNLQYLKLSQNALTGTLPAILESITTLKHLDLSDQATLGFGLNGNLLAFATQTELTELYLQHNNFEGAIPASFLTNVRKDQLATVDLRYNRFGGIIPTQLGNINQLNLYLASNLFESIPESLCGKDWNDGDVAEKNCDGLLCPAGTFNVFGRATAGVDCFQCDEPVNSQHMGNTFCGSALEHESLKIVYRSFGGPNWHSANNWLESEDHCTWEGITCWTSGEFNGLVKRIELSDNNLVGDMPFALIWQLEGLTNVDLQKNDISLPFFMIANAINLETINLSYTQTNSLMGIGEAKSLKELHLTGATLTGAIPDELFSLSSLEDLFLSHNGLSGTISAEIQQLKQLKNLYLLGNKLEGTIPPEIGYLARLEHMSLGRNKLKGSIPRQITSLPLLEFLSLENEADLSNNSFTTESGLFGPLPALDGFPRIRELYLQHNKFTGTIPDHFLQGISDKTAKLTVDLGFNEIDGSIPAELSDFDNLNLLLAGNEISNIPEDICNSIGWMNGEVAISCDSILCPPGTFNADGRQIDTTTPCETCSFSGSARKYGSTSCGPGSGDSLNARSILFDLYDATGGDSWITSDGWKSDKVPYCDWYGVVCATTTSGELFVSELNLAKNNLRGFVPPKIYFLQGLEKLDVRQNPVSITFQDITQASELKEIYIDETLVKNLDGVGGAPKLKTLHAYKNSFGGQKIPDEIFDISTLTDLNLADSMLVGTLSEKIGQLTQLQRITLDGNSLSGELPAELGRLLALKEIEISNNKWIGTIPPSWTGLNSLEALFLNNDDEKTAGVTGSLVAFANTPNLNIFSMSNNQLTGSIPSNFLSGVSDTNSLVTVRLDQNHLTGTIPSSFQIFSKLDIDATGNFITAIGDGLCNKSEWNNGMVGQYGCPGILCPAGTFSSSGRQTSSADTCDTCPGEENSLYLGDTTCATLVKQKESEILVKLFKATDGNNWKIKDGWTDANSDVCTWYGIECGGGSTVESVHLGSNNLVGSVPKEIFKLPNLKSFWLYSNPVQFSFDGIGQATKLRNLRLDSTKLRSLSGIGAGLSLVDVDVGFNQLAGPIPAGIKDLVNLESFSGTVNAFTGIVPDVSDLRKLSALRLSENKLTGSIPSFARHSNIKSIDLSNNNMVGQIPLDFLEAVNEEESLFVDLSDNMLTGFVPGSLRRFEDLTIYLRDNRITGIDPSLCSKDSWNEGDVGNFQCDGILCPVGTFAAKGRASDFASTCESCDKNQYFGGTTCGGRSGGTLLSPTVTMLLFLASAATLLL
jgi:Leucine-rich repeat (LRR) protein